MKNLVKDKATLSVCSLYLIYIVIQGVCLLFAGDDFIWFQSQSLTESFGNYAVNGRYFTNFITYLIVKYPVLRVIVYTVVHALLYHYTAKLICRGNAERWLAYSFVAVAMLSMEPSIFRQTTSWISGFTNYYSAALFTVMYLTLCLTSVRERKQKTHWYTICYAAVIGFFGSLCLETATILNLLLAAVFLTESLIRHRKPSAVHIVYLVSAAAGACCMFLNRNYSRFASGAQDEFGARLIDFSFLDTMTTLYRNFVRLYIAPYAVLNLVLAAAIGVLYYKSYYAEHRRCPKYGKAAMLLVLFYAAYSVLTQHLEAFAIVSVRYRTQSVEAALMFLYVISLLYLVWHLTARTVFHRFVLCCIASAISTLPFLVVEPINPRCFFNGYMFWMLAAGVLGAEAWHLLKCSSLMISALKRCAVLGVGVYTGIISYMLIANKYCDTVRVRYLREQLANRANILEVIELPYPNIQIDYFEEYFGSRVAGTKQEWDYDGAFKTYYGFPETLTDETQYRMVSMYSYSLTTE